MLGAMRARLAVLPGLCEVCRSSTGGRGDTGRSFCASCLARFATPRLRCPRCALPLATAAPACGGCVLAPPPFDHAVAALDYGFPWDAVIQRFKFGAAPELARPLAALLVAAVTATPRAVAAAPELVVPVPLAPARLAERGYNQAWELAREVAARMQLPARAEALQRVLDTPHQAGLDRRERERNLRNAFAPAPRAAAWLAGRRVALVDDVLTTGATVREAAAALRRAGAVSVDLWVLARTPEPTHRD